MIDDDVTEDLIWELKVAIDRMEDAIGTLRYAINLVAIETVREPKEFDIDSEVSKAKHSFSTWLTGRVMQEHIAYARQWKLPEPEVDKNKSILGFGGGGGGEAVTLQFGKGLGIAYLTGSGGGGFY